MNRPETIKLLSMLNSIWRDEVIDDVRIDGYYFVLAEFEFPALMAAAKVHMHRSKWFPKPAELLEIMAESQAPAISAGEAWELVMKQVRRNGFNGWDDVVIEDPAVLAAVKQIGWRRICLDEKPEFVRRDFDIALEDAQRRARRDVQTGTAAIVMPDPTPALTANGSGR